MRAGRTGLFEKENTFPWKVAMLGNRGLAAKMDIPVQMEVMLLFCQNGAFYKIRGCALWTARCDPGLLYGKSRPLRKGYAAGLL